MKNKLPSYRHIEAISEAVDIIANASDSATNQRYFRGLLKRLATLQKILLRLKNDQ